MSPVSQAAVRRVNTLIQAHLHSAAALPVELRGLPGWRAQAGERFWLSQQASAVSPTGVEVQAHFDNGYVITCLVESVDSHGTFCVEGAEQPFGNPSVGDLRQR